MKQWLFQPNFDIHLEMTGLGTIVNFLAIIIGSLVGLFVGNKIPKKIHEIVFKAVGVFCLFVGFKMFLKGDYYSVVVLSLIFGWLTGWFFHLERRIDLFAEKLRRAAKIKDEKFSEGFVVATLIYCVGPMAIIGAIADGLRGEHDVLFTKSVMDGVTAIGFSAGLGVGVLFSSLPVLIYQGGITLLAVIVGGFFSETMINQLTSVGGMLIFITGVNVIGVLGKKRRVPVGDLLPALVFVVLLVPVIKYFGGN